MQPFQGLQDIVVDEAQIEQCRQLLRNRQYLAALPSKPPKTKTPKVPSQSKSNNMRETLFSYTARVIRKQLSVDPSIVAALKTRRPQDDTIIYLTQQSLPPCRFINWYWLEITTQRIVEQEKYFTLSTRGITCIQQDGQVEFCDLETWLFEKRVFDRLVTMPCVARIRMALLFYLWKDQIYGQRYRQATYVLVCFLLSTL